MEKGVSKPKVRYDKWWLILLFVLPAMFFYGLFNLFGIVRTFYYSTMDWRGISTNRDLIGLANYIEVARDPAFWNALKNNMILVLVSLFIQMPGALLLALLINAKIRFTRFFRTVFFMPMLLSTVATGIMWILFYDPNFGLLAMIIRKLHLPLSTAFLQGESALPAILFVICWQFNMNINTVRKIVGHTDERTTLKHYVFDRSTPDEQRLQFENATKYECNHL